MSDTRFKDLRPGAASTASRLWPMRPVEADEHPARPGMRAEDAVGRLPPRAVGAVGLLLALIGYLRG